MGSLLGRLFHLNQDVAATKASNVSEIFLTPKPWFFFACVWFEKKELFQLLIVNVQIVCNNRLSVSWVTSRESMGCFAENVAEIIWQLHRRLESLHKTLQLWTRISAICWTSSKYIRYVATPPHSAPARVSYYGAADAPAIVRGQVRCRSHVYSQATWILL